MIKIIAKIIKPPGKKETKVLGISHSGRVQI